MSATQSAGASGTEPPAGGFTAKMPMTRLGRISMWLAAAFVIGFGVNTGIIAVVGTSTNPAVNEFSRTYLPFWGVSLFGCGFAAGAVGLVAILKDRERSAITLLTLVPMLFVMMFVLGEFLVPH